MATEAVMRLYVKKSPLRSLGLLLLACTLLLSHTATLVGAMSHGAYPDAVLQDTQTLAAADTDGNAFPSTGADFSNPQSEATVELSASAFVALLTGKSPSDSESAYLDSMLADRPFQYNNSIPPRVVETHYEHSVLTVIARPHSYTAVNGETVTWYPIQVSNGDRTLPFEAYGEDGSGRCVFENVPESADSKLEVHYSCTIHVPAALSEAYINYTWNYADRLTTAHREYEARLAAYEAYCTYLSEKAAYDLAYAEWQNYVAAQARYEKQMAAYTAYQQAMEDYREQKKLYENYLILYKNYQEQLARYEAAYATYVTELNAYNAALPLYETNRSQIQTAADVLATLDSAFVYNSRGKQMYATLIGDTVATVVNRKDELVDIGKCDPKDIDRADRCTAVLKELLTAYKDLSTLHDRFAFYQAHYSEIQQNFASLYGSLRSLYDNDIVKSTLINYDKLERFIEFLSQLYVIATGLDDTQDRLQGKDWVIYGRYDPTYFSEKPHYYQTELEPAQIPPDKNNANPSGLTCPEVELPAPVAPVLAVKKPTEPTKVTEPLEPDLVIKPAAPTPVAEPTAPTPVNDPGEKPIAPAYTTLQQQLMAAYKDGTLRRRVAEDTALSFSTELPLHLSLQNKRPVVFYDYDGRTVLYATELDDDTPIVYGGEPPVRADTEKYTYRFVGWKDADGTLYTSELGVVDESQEAFYASYESTLRNYRVTWRVDGTEAVTEVPYGSIPRYDGTPDKSADAQFSYVFTGWQIPGEDGWSHDLTAVRGDITYEAVFEAVTRSYTVTWVYGEGEENTSSAQWIYGTVPTPDRTPSRAEDDRYLYEFAGWDAEPSAVTGDVTYTALYTAIPILSSEDTASDEPPQPLLREGDTYMATVPAGGLRIDRLLKLALLRDCTVTLTAADAPVSIHLTSSIMTHMQSMGCAYLQVEAAEPLRADPHGRNCSFAIYFLNAEKQQLALRYPVTLRFSEADRYTKIYATTPASSTPTALPFVFENGEITVKVSQCMTLHRIGEYPVTLEHMTNGILTADRSVAIAGETVTLNLTFSDDSRFDTLRILGIVTGETYPFEVNADGTYTFVMPDEPVTVSAVLSRITYTVTFVVDGAVLSSETYFKGDTVRLPADPEKASTDQKVYTFIGWSPIVTVVTEDVVYTATFSEAGKGDNSTYIPPDSRNREYLLYIEVGLALSLLIATPIVTVILLKRRKKKKLSRRGDPQG